MGSPRLKIETILAVGEEELEPPRAECSRGFRRTGRGERAGDLGKGLHKRGEQELVGVMRVE